MSLISQSCCCIQRRLICRLIWCIQIRLIKLKMCADWFVEKRLTKWKRHCSLISCIQKRLIKIHFLHKEKTDQNWTDIYFDLFNTEKPDQIEQICRLISGIQKKGSSMLMCRLICCIQKRLIKLNRCADWFIAYRKDWSNWTDVQIDLLHTEKTDQIEQMCRLICCIQKRLIKLNRCADWFVAYRKDWSNWTDV